MILKGSQRSGAAALATHLLRLDENDHVEVEEIRGFVSSDLRGALAEAYATSKGTRCKQYLFSLSVNPPKDGNATRDDLIAAIEQAEERLGLVGQPRAIVIHEKNNRRHAHAVWSRVDARELKAINLPFFKTKLAELSKDLYLAHGWELPAGHKEKGKSNPLNFTLAEHQQAKRQGLDPRALKQLFQDAWKRSDDLASFKRAMREHGFYLARGDRRGFVAVDVFGKVFSISRLTGVKPKDLEARLGSPARLPGIEDCRAELRSIAEARAAPWFQETPYTAAAKTRHTFNRKAGLPEYNYHFGLRPSFAAALKQIRRKHRRELAPLRWKRRQIVRAQRSQRMQLATAHRGQQSTANRARVLRLKDWQQGALLHLTNQLPFIRKQNANESWDEYQRFRREMERQYEQQMEELRALNNAIEKTRARQAAERMAMMRRMALVIQLERNGERNAPENRPHQLTLEF